MSDSKKGPRESNSPIRSLLIYLVIVFVGGAMLAPCLYWRAQWAASHNTLVHLASQPFRRYFDRSLLGLALLGLWPMLRSAGIARWSEIGFAPPAKLPAEILKGLLLGLASLLSVVILEWICRVSSLNTSHTFAEIARALSGAILTAVLVALLEEIVFRGALFGLLRKSMAWPAALILSAAVYSAAHFIKSTAEVKPVQWDSGFVLLKVMVTHHPAMVPAFFTLLAAGGVLALAYQRSGALYFSIGLHAGWIFWLKSFKFFFRTTTRSGTFWGSGDLIDGWLACAVLTAVFIFEAVRSRTRASR